MTAAEPALVFNAYWKGVAAIHSSAYCRANHDQVTKARTPPEGLVSATSLPSRMESDTTAGTSTRARFF